MIVNQWTEAAHRGDAIGDHTRAFRDLIRSLGHESEIYSLTIDPGLEYEILPWNDSGARQGDVTIFHFVTPSVMSGAFKTLPGARVLQYHNITPAHFFKPYSERYFAVCERGRAQTQRLIFFIQARQICLGGSGKVEPLWSGGFPL